METTILHIPKTLSFTYDEFFELQVKQPFEV